MAKNSELSVEIERLIEEHSEQIVAELRARVEERLREEMIERMKAALGTPLGEAPAPVRRRRGPRAAGMVVVAAPGEACGVLGCERPRRSMGYCGAHYQSARKYDWPRPCPEGFDPPVRKRGRPSKAEVAAAAEAEAEERESSVLSLGGSAD